MVTQTLDDTKFTPDDLEAAGHNERASRIFTRQIKWSPFNSGGKNKNETKQQQSAGSMTGAFEKIHAARASFITIKRRRHAPGRSTRNSQFQVLPGR